MQTTQIEFNMDKFRLFIQDMLKIAKINAEYRQVFTNDENIITFLTAFTGLINPAAVLVLAWV